MFIRFKPESPKLLLENGYIKSYWRFDIKQLLDCHLLSKHTDKHKCEFQTEILKYTDCTLRSRWWHSATKNDSVFSRILLALHVFYTSVISRYMYIVPFSHFLHFWANNRQLLTWGFVKDSIQNFNGCLMRFSE